MSAVTIAELWRRGPVGGPPRFPIAQFPNPPLLLAFAGWGLAAAAGGTAHDVGWAIFTLGLAVWALQEAVGGVDWFRRLLGVGVLAWIVASLAGEVWRLAIELPLFLHIRQLGASRTPAYRAKRASRANVTLGPRAKRTPAVPS